MAILTKAQLKAENSSSFPNNNSQAITPQILRDYNVDIIDTLVDSNSTASFARTDLTNEFSATNNFTSISASSFVSASAFTGDGSRLTNITASVALPILDEGVLQGYATSMNFTGSAISAVVTAGTAVVQVNIDNVGLVTTASFNAYTSSTNTSITNLNASSASQQISINALNQSSASQQVSINALNVYTASQDSSSIVNSITELNAWSASAKIELVNLNTSVTNLNSFSSSANSSITQLNASSASQQVSINALNVSSASLNTFSASAQISINSINAASSSWITESETGSFVTTNTTQTITAGKQFDAQIGMTSTTPIVFGGFATNTISSNGGRGININATETDGNNAITIKTGAGNSQPNNTITLITDGSATTNKITLQSANIIITGSTDISGNLTASLQQGYVWVGNASGISTTVATSSFATNVSGFVTTASFNSYTQSNDQRVSSLEAATSSYVTESETGSFARYDVSNPWSANQTFTNITAVSASFTYVQTLYETASVIYSSGSNQFGDELSDTQTLSGSVKVQGSLTVNGTPVLTSSVDISGLTTTASFNAYTQSNDSKVNSLINATASYATSTITASSLITASAVGNTITFTKGDASTFNVSVSSTPIDTGSLVTTSSFNSYTSSNDQKVDSLIAATGSYATTGSNSFNGNQTITGSLTISGSGQNDLSVIGQVFVSSTATGATTQPRITVSGSGGQSIIGRASIQTENATNAAALNPVATFAYNKTTLDEIGLSLDTTAFTNWTYGPAIYTNDPTDNYPAIFGFQNKANYTDGRVTVLTPLSASAGFTASLQNGYAWVGNSLGQNTQVATSSFGTAINTGSFATLGANTFTGSQTISSSLNVSGSANFVGGDVNFTDQGRNINIDVDRTIIKGQKPTLISSSLDIQGSLTASLANGYAWVGDATNHNVLVATSSFATNVSNLATTGSNSFNGNQNITGSLILSSSNAVELTVIGNMVVTGSAFGNVVSMSITANTASMDLSRGNYFTLTLADTATTHISASNVQPGVSATLVITTGTNSSASLAPTMLQPSGSAYSATNGSAKKDVLSIVAVASNVPFVVSTKNMI